MANRTFYWVSFITFIEKDVVVEIIPQTTYAEFVCYRNEVHVMAFKTEVVVQGLIETNALNMTKGSAIYDKITLYGDKFCNISPVPLALLDSKRLFLQYACVMYPNATLYTSISGGALLQATVPDIEEAIRNYIAVNDKALTAKDFQDSRAIPFDLFNWWRFCERVSALEFEQHEKVNEYIVQTLDGKLLRYCSNKIPIDHKEEFIFRYVLGDNCIAECKRYCQTPGAKAYHKRLQQRYPT